MLGISGYNLQCLGLVFIIGVGIYFLYKALKVNNNIIEGLTTKDEEQIKTTMADKTKLIVENISEARPNIEDTLTELSEFIKVPFIMH